MLFLFVKITLFFGGENQKKEYTNLATDINLGAIIEINRRGFTRHQFVPNGASHGVSVQNGSRYNCVLDAKKKQKA